MGRNYGEMGRNEEKLVELKREAFLPKEAMLSAEWQIFVCRMRSFSQKWG